MQAISGLVEAIFAHPRFKECMRECLSIQKAKIDAVTDEIALSLMSLCQSAITKQVQALNDSYFALDKEVSALREQVFSLRQGFCAIPPIIDETPSKINESVLMELERSWCLSNLQTGMSKVECQKKIHKLELTVNNHIDRVSKTIVNVLNTLADIQNRNNQPINSTSVKRKLFGIL